MFTGLVSDVGRIERAVSSPSGARFTVRTSYDVSAISIGASIAHNGCCLTVIALDGQEQCYDVDVSAETLSVTTLGSWAEGSAVNLEQSLRLGEELGGHLVYGHVDGLAVIEDMQPEGESLRYRFRVPAELGKYIAPKGSVALDGVSLTVNEVLPNAEETVFGVNIIPHTRSCTTFGTLKPGHRVNLETDMLARYVDRLIQDRQMRPAG